MTRLGFTGNKAEDFRHSLMTLYRAILPRTSLCRALFAYVSRYTGRGSARSALRPNQRRGRRPMRGRSFTNSISRAETRCRRGNHVPCRGVRASPCIFSLPGDNEVTMARDRLRSRRKIDGRSENEIYVRNENTRARVYPARSVYRTGP